MPTYVSLLKYTAKGIESIKGSPKRIEAAKQAAKAAGGQIKGIYVVMGRYDLVTVFEMPDDESAAKFALGIGAQGNVTTETLRAFTEPEFLKLLGSLP